MTIRMPECNQRLYLSKAEYTKGTKKQKMNMSKAIVEAIYSMEPPGRFLKQCPDTGQWNELSKREAADRVAQAMAYAVSGKDKSERRRERRRQRPLPLPQDVVDAASLRSVDRPTNHQLDGVPRTTSAHHGLAARVSTAAVAGTNNDAESAVRDDHTDMAANALLLPDNNFILQRQLLIQQLLQSNGTTIPPSSPAAPMNANHDGLVPAMAQALQHHQLPLQYALGHDLLGLLQTQTPLQPASLEGLSQILAQTQQQQQALQQQLLHQHSLIQRLLSHQNVLPSASLPPPTLSDYFPFLSQGTLLPENFLRGTFSNYPTGSQSLLATNDTIQNQVQPHSHPSNVYSLLSMLNTLNTLQNQNIGLFHAPQQTQQRYDQLQRSLVRQQLLASSLAASNQQLLHQLQPPQSLPLDLLCQAWQTAVRRQNDDSHPPPDTAAATSCVQQEQEIEDEKQSGSDDEDDRA
jgi:hypothetical protein